MPYRFRRRIAWSGADRKKNKSIKYTKRPKSSGVFNGFTVDLQRSVSEAAISLPSALIGVIPKRDDIENGCDECEQRKKGKDPS